MNSKDLNTIQETIAYTFRNEALLAQAFVRRSYTAENGGENNEVLEFIGDKALDLAVINSFAKQYGSITEIGTFRSEFGENILSAAKTRLVNTTALSECVDRLKIARFLVLSNGDAEKNVGEQKNVKADLFEAILGAVALDCNWNMETILSVCTTMLGGISILSNELEIKNQQIKEEMLRRNKQNKALKMSFNKHRAAEKLRELNAEKSDLSPVNKLEICAREDLFGIPGFGFSESNDEDGNPIWECTCIITDFNLNTKAFASSKKDAKAQAASDMINSIINSPDIALESLYANTRI